MNAGDEIPASLSADNVSPYLPNFTRFGEKHTAIATAAKEEAKDASSTFNPDEDKLGIGCIEHQTLRCAMLSSGEYHVRLSVVAEQQERIKQQRCNIYGPMNPDEDTHIAHVIVELLGPACKSGK